ncbi:MAG: hypothetical protein ACERKZ_20650 [Lachnotalea sp.]
MKSIDRLFNRVQQNAEQNKPRMLAGLAYPDLTCWIAKADLSNRIQGLCVTSRYDTKEEAIEALERIKKEYPNTINEVPIIVDDMDSLED